VRDTVHGHEGSTTPGKDPGVGQHQLQSFNGSPISPAHSQSRGGVVGRRRPPGYRSLAGREEHEPGRALHIHPPFDAQAHYTRVLASREEVTRAAAVHPMPGSSSDPFGGGPCGSSRARVTACGHRKGGPEPRCRKSWGTPQVLCGTPWSCGSVPALGTDLWSSQRTPKQGVLRPSREAVANDASGTVRAVVFHHWQQTRHRLVEADPVLQNRPRVRAGSNRRIVRQRDRSSASPHRCPRTAHTRATALWSFMDRKGEGSPVAA
jgi:hypothetical protein